MNPPLNYRRLLLRYLLDEMSVDERASVDDALIADQEFSDGFQEAQYDLIDAYVANELSIDIRKRVELALLGGKSGEISHPLAIAMQQARDVDRRSGANREPSAATGKGVPQVRSRKFRLIFSAALAACLFLVVALIQWRRTTIPGSFQKLPEVASIAASGPTVGKSNSVQSSAPPEKPSHEHRFPVPRIGILVVAMPMGTARGADPIPIQIHRGIKRLEVQWPLSRDAAAQPYTLAVASGRSDIAVVPQIGPLTTMDGIRVARFHVPADKLAAGEYLFRLGTADGSSQTPIAETLVRVSR